MNQKRKTSHAYLRCCMLNELMRHQRRNKIVQRPKNHASNEERLLAQGKNWKGFEERDAFGLSAGQPVSQKQPDQTESGAKPNTSGLQSGTEKQSCSPCRDHTAHSQCLDQAHSAKKFATTFLACDPDKQSKVYLGSLITGCITCSNGDQLI